MDLDYSDYEDSETFEEQMEEYPTHSLADEDDLSHDISFEGHIDDIYDPEIKYAHDRLVDHTEDLLHAKNADEAQSALNHGTAFAVLPIVCRISIFFYMSECRLGLICSFCMKQIFSMVY